MSSELIQYEPGSLAITREPTEVLADAHKAAKALMEVVSSKKKQITFNKEVYLESGDWQTVGKFYGVTAKVESTEFVNFGEVRGWKAAAIAIDVTTGREVSRAEAMCLDDEENWGLRPKYEWQDRIVDGKRVWDKELFNGKGGYVRDKVCVSMTPTPLFQLLSMAQTRACSKVLSNLFKWVVVLAGYKPTPAEEMTDTTVEEREPSPSGTTSTQTTTPQQSSASAGVAPSGTTDPNAEPQIRPKSQKGTQPPTQSATVAPRVQESRQEPLQGEVQAEPVISPAQGKRFFAIMKSAGLSDEDCKKRLASIGYHGHRDGIPKSMYEKAIDAIDPELRFHTNTPRN